MRSLFSNAVIAVASIAMTSGIVAFADPANASVPSEAPHVVVQTSDLNLGSSSGRATAERRIHNAADTVCGFDSHPMAQAGQCRSIAIRNAKQALARIATIG